MAVKITDLRAWFSNHPTRVLQVSETGHEIRDGDGWVPSSPGHQIVEGHTVGCGVAGGSDSGFSGNHEDKDKIRTTVASGWLVALQEGPEEIQCPWCDGLQGECGVEIPFDFQFENRCGLLDEPPNITGRSRRQLSRWSFSRSSPSADFTSPPSP